MSSKRQATRQRIKCIKELPKHSYLTTDFFFLLDFRNLDNCSKINLLAQIIWQIRLHIYYSEKVLVINVYA